MSDVAERYRRRADIFQTLIASVPDDRWSWPSPCDDWDARDVVRHIVDMHLAMLPPVGRAPTPGPPVDENPLSAFTTARADVEAILDDPEIAAGMTHSPAGDLPAAQMIDRMVSEDMIFHGWDLARATGQDDTIDAEEVAVALPDASRIPPEMHEPGAFGPGVVVFGPVVDVPADAPPQDKLLGLLGRDPQWRNPRL